MKNKIILLIATSFIITLPAFSQLGIKAGFALGEPLDDNTSNIHLGFDVGVTYDITERIRAEVLLELLMRKEEITTGYFGSTTVKSSYMPVTVGADYKILTDQFQPYAGFNIGLYRFASEIMSNSSSNSYFGLFPKVGASFEVMDNILIDAAIKYHVAFRDNNQGPNGSNITIFGANIGLIYKIN